jgi:transposase-like protein
MDSRHDPNRYHQRRALPRVAIAESHGDVLRKVRPTPSPGVAATVQEAPECDGLRLLLQLARRSRAAAHGSGCPRCGEVRVIRWGGFAGRQRYRCHGCSRTFSDFTCTPAAYTKHADLWITNAQHIAEGATIRSIAAHLAVSPSTVFRWRHATLGALRGRSVDLLTGTAGLKQLVLRQSEKGSRSLDRPPFRHTGVPFGPDRVIVLFARDSSGATAAAVIGRWLANAEMVHAFLKEKFVQGVIIFGESGSMGPHAAGCRRAGLVYRCGARRRPGCMSIPAEIASVRTLVAEYRCWMRRFRGVATRYLAHYLRWYRFLVGTAPAASAAEAGFKLLLDALTGGFMARLA